MRSTDGETTGEVHVEVLDADVSEALTLLDAAQHALGAPVVDEAEEQRLRELVAGGRRRPGWVSLLARRDGRARGYAGVVLPRSPGGEAVADLAVAPDEPGWGDLHETLLEAVDAAARREGAGRVQLWIRHTHPDLLTPAADRGYRVARRLGVLGRELTDLPPRPAAPGGHTIRAVDADADAAAVVEVLAAAYADTEEAGWDLERFHERTRLPWFAPDDLLVAESPDGSVDGIHWLKRRDADVGEVYNLAVHPRAQGARLGPVLLVAGLEHLRDVGRREVLLWVDLANDRAVRLYTSHGFVTRWEDVALLASRTSPGER